MRLFVSVDRIGGGKTWYAPFAFNLDEVINEFERLTNGKINYLTIKLQSLLRLIRKLNLISSEWTQMNRL